MEFGDDLSDRFLSLGFGADVNFLQALLRLHRGFDPSRDLALNLDGAGAAIVTEGFAAVGAADDDADHAG